MYSVRNPVWGVRGGLGRAGPGSSGFAGSLLQRCGGHVGWLPFEVLQSVLVPPGPVHVCSVVASVWEQSS